MNRIFKVLVVFVWKLRLILTLFLICFKNQLSRRLFLQFYAWIIVANIIERLSYYRMKSITLELNSFLLMWWSMLIFNDFSNFWKLARLFIFSFLKLAISIVRLNLRIFEINKRFFTDIAFMTGIMGSLFQTSYILSFKSFRLRLGALIDCCS